jgi:hypothetical protein
MKRVESHFWLADVVETIAIQDFSKCNQSEIVIGYLRLKCVSPEHA